MLCLHEQIKEVKLFSVKILTEIFRKVCNIYRRCYWSSVKVGDINLLVSWCTVGFQYRYFKIQVNKRLRRAISLSSTSFSDVDSCFDLEIFNTLWELLLISMSSRLFVIVRSFFCIHFHKHLRISFFHKCLSIPFNV